MDTTRDNYFIQFAVSSCEFEMRINDIPAFRYRSNGSIATKLYINHLVGNKENIFSINLLPLDKTGFVLTTLFEGKIVHTINGRETVLCETSFVYSSKNPVPAMSLQEVFKIPTPMLKESLWLKNDVKELNESQKGKVKNKFSFLFNLFRTKNVNEIMEEGYNKDYYFCDRYFMNIDERTKYLQSDLENKLNDISWQFTDYKETEWIFKSYANNKLFTYELSNFLSPIELKNTSLGQNVNLPIYLTLIDNEVVWVL